MVGLLWTLENLANSAKGRLWLSLRQCLLTYPLLLPVPLVAQVLFSTPLAPIHWWQPFVLEKYGVLPLLALHHW
jgi:hypothetical protein